MRTMRLDGPLSVEQWKQMMADLVCVSVEKASVILGSGSDVVVSWIVLVLDNLRNLPMLGCGSEAFAPHTLECYRICFGRLAELEAV